MKALGSLLVFTLSIFSGSANLIVNGSFEDGNFSGEREPGVVQLFNGSTAIDGWQVMPGNNLPGGDIAWESTSNPWGFRPSEGSRFIDLTGYANDTRNPHGAIALTQKVNLQAAQNYLLTFDLGSSRYYDNNIDPRITVYVNGKPCELTFIGNNTTVNDDPGFRNHWSRFSYNFVADGGMASIKFVGTTPGTSRVLHLDNVSLTVVPEAPTLISGALLLLPFALSAMPRLRERIGIKL